MTGNNAGAKYPGIFTLYEIRLKGHLDDLWLPFFAGLRLEHFESGETLLSGSLQDQAALHEMARTLA
jgi:hypothetical protein